MVALNITYKTVFVLRFFSVFNEIRMDKNNFHYVLPVPYLFSTHLPSMYKAQNSRLDMLLSNPDKQDFTMV